MSEWQFKQTVDTLQLLVVELPKSPVAMQLDWAYWKEASRSLEANHPTRAINDSVDAFLKNRRQVIFPVSTEQHDILKQMSRLIRARQYSIRTELSYIDWASRFFKFIQDKQIAEIKASDDENFLSELAIERTVSASTQNQTLNAIVFLLTQVMGRPREEFQF